MFDVGRNKQILILLEFLWMQLDSSRFNQSLVDSTICLVASSCITSVFFLILFSHPIFHNIIVFCYICFLLCNLTYVEFKIKLIDLYTTAFTNRTTVISTRACTFLFSLSLTGHKYSDEMFTSGSFEGTEKSAGTRADEAYESDA